MFIPQPLGLSRGWQRLHLSPVAQLYQVAPLAVSSLWSLVNTLSFGPFGQGWTQLSFTPNASPSPVGFLYSTHALLLVPPLNPSVTYSHICCLLRN